MINNSKKMFLYNSDSFIGKLVKKSAKKRDWKINSISNIKNNSSNVNFSNFKHSISKLTGSELQNSNFTWVTPEYIKSCNDQENFFNFITVPIYLSLAFSELCNHNSKNSINIIFLKKILPLL